MAKHYPAAMVGFGKALAAEKAWAIMAAIEYELGKPKGRHEHTGANGGPIQKQDVPVDARPSIEEFIAEFRQHKEEDDGVQRD
jgi:hypothetical protein